jgi:pimeloyl-ACP methyl ester carboxylesterase
MNTLHYAYEYALRVVLRVPYRLNVRDKHIGAPGKRTLVFIHGLGDSGLVWRQVIAQLPKGTNYIVVDLLGHGGSTHSRFKVYNAMYQARYVLAACERLKRRGPLVFVGHSFGSIVSVECARLHRRTESLVLCALPLYTHQTLLRGRIKEPESILFAIYDRMLQHPNQVIRAYQIAEKLRLAGGLHSEMTEETFFAFTETVRAGIMNQQTAIRLSKLQLPIQIIYGRFDPLIVPRNIKRVAQANPNITVQPIMNDHAVRGPMIRAILDAVNVK